MSRLLRKPLNLLIIFLLPFVALSQETTATLSGRVTDAKGIAVDGATITVVFEPTATKTATLTNSKGIFVLPNLKPGGPYTVTVSFVGLDEQKFDNINLSLGSNPDISVQMKNNEKSLQEV